MNIKIVLGHEIITKNVLIFPDRTVYVLQGGVTTDLTDVAVTVESVWVLSSTQKRCPRVCFRTGRCKVLLGSHLDPA